MTSEVLDVHETRVRALIDGDLETLDQIVADDLTFTTPHGTVLTKRMVFDSVRSGEMKVTRMDVDELVVREYGNTAIVTYRTDTTYTDGNVLVDGSVRSTTVYLRRNGFWKLVTAQQTLIRG
tara:strand:+ start:3463 stop:3828 length:366 start_codon:yes stop_codon:yes gene_type:complete